MIMIWLRFCNSQYLIIANTGQCHSLLAGHKVTRISDGSCLNVFVFAFLVDRVIFSHHFEQMPQRSQVRLFDEQLYFKTLFIANRN